MSTTFPGAVDSFTNPTSTDDLNSVTVPHADQHANANDAIEAIETYALTLTISNGKSGGQTIAGDTAASGDLTLKGTSHATAGSVFIQSSTIFEVDGGTGQLKLPTTGSGAGLLVGGDVQLYRAATDVWASPDSLRLGGYIGVGSTSAPSNTTAGDITGLRLHLGTDGVFSASTYALEVNAKRALFSGTYSPAGDYEAFVNVSPTFTGTKIPQGLSVYANIQPSASISTAYGVVAISAANPPTGVTISTMVAGFFRADYGNVSGAVTTGQVIFVAGPAIGGSLKPTTQYGIYIENQGASGITTAVGLSIAKPTGATNNYYIRLDTADGTDPTGGGGAAAGRIPVLIGGVARFLAYY